MQLSLTTSISSYAIRSVDIKFKKRPVEYGPS